MGRFYGEESAAPEIRALYNELWPLWTLDTCAPRLRPDWTPENRTLGQCSVTAFLVQDLLGGKVYGVPLSDGSVHCFNEALGCVFDLTSAQFGETKMSYVNQPEQSREAHFADAGKRARYELLKERLLAAREEKK
ncbi:MAG: hypothetical protein IKH34_01975 [Oscillospiraceae bacterium]|nr:hypothetical protein [Oscillospiraceae bacterium]